MAHEGYGDGMAKYVSANLTPDAATALRRLSLRLSADADRRVPQSEALLHALKIAEGHWADVVKLATGPADDEETTE